MDPTLPHPVDTQVDALRTTAYTGALTTRTVFVQLSPLTHDPLFVARLLHHPAIPAATALYDFIPFDEPDHYLAQPSDRLDYHVRLRWLARYDRFFPISAHAADRLHAILGPRHATITGAPLDPAFETPGTVRRRHLLVIGGGDPRKNPGHAIRAHARAAPLQSARIPIVVIGAYDPEWIASQRATIAALGGDPALLEAPGHIAPAELVVLYTQALAVIAPSLAEGFSLPVIEAMATGAPVLASAIPAHAELLDPAQLFPPDNSHALIALYTHLADPAWTATALARQATVWPPFRAADVAARFWSGVAALLPPLAAPAALRGARPRVALLTPLPPDRSGVAHYSAALCPALGARTELTLFAPNSASIRAEGAAAIQPLSALPALSSRYDRVINVLGNSSFHARILDIALRHGGACIAHDGRMLDLFEAHYGPARTEAMAARELGRPLRPWELWHWMHAGHPPAAMLFGDIVAAAEPLIVHAAAVAEAITTRYGRPVLHLPFSLYRHWAAGTLDPTARQAARARLARHGARPGQRVIASFGFVHASKAPEDTVWALEWLRGWGIDARVHFVGGMVGDQTPLRTLVDDLGLAPHVWFAGDFVSEAVFRDHLAGADAAVQLRLPGAGSVSGGLSDCLGADLPALASTTLAHSIDAQALVRIVPDHPSPLLVAEGLAALLDGPAPPAGTRDAYLATHNFDHYTRLLCEAMGL